MNNIDTQFESIRFTIFENIQNKHIDIDCLAFDLGIDSKTFVDNFSHIIDDFSFYLQTLSLVEHWEG